MVIHETLLVIAFKDIVMTLVKYDLSFKLTASVVWLETFVKHFVLTYSETDFTGSVAALCWI